MPKNVDKTGDAENPEPAREGDEFDAVIAETEKVRKGLRKRAGAPVGDHAEGDFPIDIALQFVLAFFKWLRDRNH